MQVFSVTSGKGGVGKTNIICNLAVELGRRGQRVLLIDCDLGLANVDIVMGFKPKANLYQLLQGEATLEEVLIEGAPNVTVLPATSGIREMTRITDEQFLSLMTSLNSLERDFDVVLLDTGAGIGDNVLYFNTAAQEILVVSTPEPTSITDAYAIMKVLSQSYQIKRFNLLVNRARSRKDAVKVYRYLTTVADQYLDVAIDFFGHVVADEAVSKAVMERKTFLDAFPDSPAAGCIRDLAEEVMRRREARPPSGNMQLFWRRMFQQGTD
jgi:flagellar biosynthesis protein FlhG